MTINWWMDGFLVYIAIWVTSDLREVPYILQYLHLIHNIACNMPGPLCRHYIHEFQISCQANPSLLWASTHPQLYF